MFFNKKNILALTASAFVLGGLSISANAATGDYKSETDGLSQTGSAATDGTRFSADGHEEATKFSAGNNITGKSDAHVKLTDGYLTLNVVPSFGFGNASASTNGKTLNSIIDNDATLKDDTHYGSRNTYNQLSVTDSRKATSDAGSIAGYKVSAKMDNFNTVDPTTGDRATTGGNSNFILKLKNPKLDADDNSKVHNKGNVNLVSDNSTSVDNVLSSDAAGTGDAKLTFNNGSLYVPGGLKAGNTYAGQITWTLAPNTSN